MFQILRFNTDEANLLRNYVKLIRWLMEDLGSEVQIIKWEILTQFMRELTI